ncbi:hypothetical protein [Longimicrobium sp.]|uniref:hypothetical protein n=1 Tax=Longimicrobium sp. TaxID=2029185 RepID=UPI002B9E753C|nr:hypothetical protein [Longimicrobium sp.]HSU14521.1 hypothetical protein [Longimicrobium sp.]
MATLAHPTSGEFGRPRTPTAMAREALERAVDTAPSRIPPPRGWLRRLFARDRSARALIERYRLWPEIEYVHERISRELGPARVEVTAEDEFGYPYVAVDYYVAPGAGDEHLDLENALGRELIARLGSKRFARLLVVIHRDWSRKTGNHEL